MKISEFIRNLPTEKAPFPEWAEILGRKLTITESLLLTGERAEAMVTLMADMAAVYEGVLDAGPDAGSEPPVARESEEPCGCDACCERRLLIQTNRSNVARGLKPLPVPTTLPHASVFNTSAGPAQ